MLTLTEAVAEIPKIERKDIVTTLDIADENTTFVRRRLYHISEYLLKREEQITKLSQNLLDEIDDKDFINQFNSYSSITARYRAKDSELSPILNIVNIILSIRLSKSKMYVREAIEVTKNISEIALELDMLDTDNDESIVSQIDEAKTALNS
jgi:hypothetical protein